MELMCGKGWRALLQRQGDWVGMVVMAWQAAGTCVEGDNAARVGQNKLGVG